MDEEISLIKKRLFNYNLLFTFAALKSKKIIMKKIYSLCILLVALTFSSKAQNIILNEDFEDTTTYVNIIITTPSGNDTTWIDADLDGLADQSGGSRPNEWFITRGFADVDSTNTVMASNSWTLDPTAVANYLILPPIHLNDASGMFYWKSAPRQTPRYLDGFQVLLSTTQNFDNNFTDTLKLYAEFLSGDSSSSFANYTFSNGFVFGSDGQWLEDNGDSARWIGILRPDSASLAGYAGQTIYLAFCHGTVDDNLLSIDDIKVTGSGTVLAFTPSDNNFSLSTFPNPASDKFTIQYSLPSTGTVNLSVFDVTGKKVKTILNNMCVKGDYSYDVNINDLPGGNYNVVLKTLQGESVSKITKM